MERRPRLTLLALMVCCCLCHRGADGAAAEEGAPHSLGGDAAAAQRAVEQSGSDSPYWQQGGWVLRHVLNHSLPATHRNTDKLRSQAKTNYSKPGVLGHQ
jgi:hypothetical protein